MMTRIATAVLILASLASCGGVNKQGHLVPPSPPDVFQGYSMAHGADGSVIVTRNAPMFTNSDGAEARQAAEKLCPAGVKTSPNDRFQGGAWIFVGGCQ
uniref:hypothetical protein n=1 Tax=Paenirhodobacter enshiensis TaxID=1105367 RepID=UPI0035AE0569